MTSAHHVDTVPASMTDGNSFRCSSCGLVQFSEGATACKRCGAPAGQGEARGPSLRPSAPTARGSFASHPSIAPRGHGGPGARGVELGVVAGGADDPDIRRLAHAYRRMMLMFGLILALVFGGLLLVAGATAALGEQAGGFLLLAGLGVVTIVTLVYYWWWFRTAVALWGTTTAIIGAIAGAILPGVALIALLLIVSQSNRRLKLAGIPVGFFGPLEGYD